jgi:hypothetical protein
VTFSISISCAPYVRRSGFTNDDVATIQMMITGQLMITGSEDCRLARERDIAHIAHIAHAAHVAHVRLRADRRQPRGVVTALANVAHRRDQ